MKRSSPFVSRRFFIASAASFGAFSGCRLFEAPAGKYGSGVPRLRFGVVSDIHITHVGADGKMEAWGNNLTFKHTLEWFRDQGVDAVMVVGDMADNGMVSQLEAVAQAWYSVFPDDKAPDGRKVEKLFVYGNHDYHGYLYGDHAVNRHAKEANDTDFEVWSRSNVLRTDMGGWWKKIFHEDYSRLYRKTIKGYTFLGQHWDDGNDMRTKYGCGEGMFGAELQAFLDTNASVIDPALPFFYFQHPHLKNTCYGSWAWGHDGGKSTAALSKFANAIAFSGHSHYSLTDERSIWQGDFTSVGTSSLRYSGMPYNARQPIGYENTTTECKPAENDALKMTGRFNPDDCRQGMLWDVYSDCIVIKRREFLSNMFVGNDWVMPIPAAESKPFAFAARAKKAIPPEFSAVSALVVNKVKANTRATSEHPSVEKDAFEILIPPVAVTDGSRVHEFEVKAENAAGKSAVFHVMAEGYNHAPGHKRTGIFTKCVLALDRLPSDVKKISVTPLDCWWNGGKAISAQV